MSKRLQAQLKGFIYAASTLWLKYVEEYGWNQSIASDQKVGPLRTYFLLKLEKTV